MKLLASGIGVTALAWGVLYLRDSPPRRIDPLDQFIITEIAITFAFAGAVMLASRRFWTFRAVGLFLSSIGVAVLFGATAYIAEFGQIAPGTREGLTDLARVLLGIGGAMLFAGLAVYSFRRWGYAAFADGDVLDDSGGGAVIDTPGYRGRERRIGPADRRRDPYGRTRGERG